MDYFECKNCNEWTRLDSLWCAFCGQKKDTATGSVDKSAEKSNFFDVSDEEWADEPERVNKKKKKKSSGLDAMLSRKKSTDSETE